MCCRVNRKEESYVGKSDGYERGEEEERKPQRRWSDCNRDDLQSIEALATGAADKWKSLVRISAPAPA